MLSDRLLKTNSSISWKSRINHKSQVLLKSQWTCKHVSRNSQRGTCKNCVDSTTLRQRRTSNCSTASRHSWNNARRKSLISSQDTKQVSARFLRQKHKSKSCKRNSKTFNRCLLLKRNRINACLSICRRSRKKQMRRKSSANSKRRSAMFNEIKRMRLKKIVLVNSKRYQSNRMIIVINIICF